MRPAQPPCAPPLALLGQRCKLRRLPADSGIFEKKPPPFMELLARQALHDRQRPGDMFRR